jgi:hypothetical protein
VQHRPARRVRYSRVACVAVIASIGLSACSSSQSTPGTTLVADSVLIGKPAALPAGDADHAAVTLADQVAAGGTARLPALLAAIRASGLGVRDLAVGGKLVLQPAEPNQNVVLQAGEVYGMALMLDRGYALSLMDLGELIRSFDPTVFAGAPISDLLVDGIRAGATGTVPTRRFWGQFLAELGRKAAEPFDLLTTAPGTAQLDVVQVEFVLLAVFGDLSNKVAPLLKATPAPATPSASAVLKADVAKGPCSPGEREAEILDATYTATSYGMEALIDYIGEHLPGEAVAKFAVAIPWMNAALGLLKFALTMATFDAKVELSGGEPLVRTKDTTAGQERDLTVTVKVNTKQSTFVNCLRLLLNAAGLDFSLPQDGPVEGAEITWTMLQGNQSVRLCTKPCGAGGTDVRMGHTETNGEATVAVEGIPQKRKLPDTVKPVMQHAVVRAGVNLKPANLFRDIVDAAGGAGVGGAGIIVIPAEILTRAGFFGAGLGFDVRDWGERWKIDATLHFVGQDGTGTVDYNWIGTADVNADGIITGEGTGLISGMVGCNSGGGVEFTTGGVVFTTVGGGYGAVFGGTKEGSHFNLSIMGTAPSIQLGSFGGAYAENSNVLCDSSHEQVLNLLTSAAIDPASVLGRTSIPFEAAVGGQESGMLGDGTATITIRATQLP